MARGSDGNPANPLNALREELAETRRQLVASQEQVQELRRRNHRLTEELRLEKEEDKGEAVATIRRLRKQLVGMQSMKYAYLVFWKKRPNVPGGGAHQLIDDIYGLIAKEGSVRGVWAGHPSKETGIGEVAMLMLFDDVEGFKQYQNDPSTKVFHNRHGRGWEIVKTIDLMVK